MSEGRSHSLFVYGVWLHARYCDDRRVWGLDPTVPARVVQASRKDGFIAATTISLGCEGAAQLPHCEDSAALVSVVRSDHCWAQWLGDRSRTVDDIAMRPVVFELPDLLVQRLAVPAIDGVDLDFLDPPLPPDAGFVEQTLWPIGGELPDRDHGLGLLAGETEIFRYRLVDLFARLVDYRIFGCEVNTQGWAARESWDLVAKCVPTWMQEQWGWTDASAMRLCWCSVAAMLDADKEEQASDLYGANGMNEEWWDRVDIYRLPDRSVTNAVVHFDGPDDGEKKEIGRRIVDAAGRVGLTAEWSGDPDRAVQVRMQV